MKTLIAAICFFTLLAVTGCSSVDVTPTGGVRHASTDPSSIEILKTPPAREYEELGDVTAFNFNPHDTARMHDELRAKAATLGANAIVLTSEGVTPNGRRFAMGVAVAWK